MIEDKILSYVFVKNQIIYFDEGPNSLIFPVFTVGKDYELIPILPGKPLDENDKPSIQYMQSGLIGLYVTDNYLNRIDFNKLILFCDISIYNFKKEFPDKFKRVVEDTKELFETSNKGATSITIFQPSVIDYCMDNIGSEYVN